jgi:photosystem II stability/assembly factor-like uncharacterized protein
MRSLWLAISSLVICTIAQAGIGAWTTAGPEGVQGADIAVSPAAPDVVLVATAGAIFKSVNAGSNWARSGAAIPYVSKVWMHPTLANTYLALGYSRLYRSTNGGTSWANIGTGLPASASASLVALAVDPSNPNNVFVLDTYAGLFRSTNGGTLFTPVSVVVLPTTGYFQSMAIDPTLPSRMIVNASEMGAGVPTLYRSTDSGVSFSPLNGVGAPVDFSDGGIAFSTTVSGTVLHGYFRSTDGGSTWAGGVALIPGGNARGLNYYRPGANEFYAASATGVYRSTDHGSSWAVFATGHIDNGTDLSDLVAVAYRPGPAPATLYALSFAGSFFKTAPGGTTFSQSNTGLIASNIRAVAVHPSSANVLLAGWGDVGTYTSPAMFRSINAGASWVRSNAGLFLDEVRDIEIDPNAAAAPASTVVYAAGWDLAPNGQPPASRRSSIVKSTDGGVSWAHVPLGAFSGLTDFGKMGRARNIAIDRNSRVGGVGPSQKVYFSARGNYTCPSVGAGTVPLTLVGPRLWKSTNAGTSWVSIDSLPVGTCVVGIGNIESIVAKDIVIDSSNSNILYVSSFLASGYNPAAVPAQPVPTISNGVFKSIDGGASWTPSSTGLPRVVPANASSSYRDVLALAIDPVNPLILYAASNPTSGTGAGRVYKTINGGANWTLSSTGISGQDVRALLIDPADHNKIYAATGGNGAGPGGVYFSADAGVTWNSTSVGLPASSATALEIDRSGVDPILYAGTNLGLWNVRQVPDLDADGPSNTLEGTAPFSGDGNEDGVPDNSQANVASINGVMGLNAATRRPSANADVTISVTGIPAGTCTQTNDASAAAADDIGPTENGYAFPVGTVRFELLNCTRAFVSVRFHNQVFDPLYRFRSFGPEIIGDPGSVAWRALTSAGYTGNTWTFLLDDNTPGDNRDEANRILFIGGPATEQMFKNGFE